MKSMLQEASSVAKAVDLAWHAAGCPAEFTIKVLQREVKGFLGCFTKKTAIVSIFYDPRKQGQSSEQKPQQRRNRSHEQRVAPATKNDSHRHEGDGGHATDESAREPRYRERRTERFERDGRDGGREDRDTRHRSRSDRGDYRDSEARAGWSDVYLLDIGDWLSELLRQMDMNVRFSMSVDRQMLRVQLAEPLVSAPEQERHVCASLSVLLLQFLRRKHPGKCSGLRLLILSSRQES